TKKFYGTRNDNKKQWFYPYNPNPDVIIAQMKADAKKGTGREDVTIEEMVKHYRGQVFYLNMTRKYKYALSKFDSVVNDADSEFRFSLFVNREMRTGFLGKVIAIIKGEDEDNTVEKDLGSLLGAENVGSLLAIRAEQTDEIDKVLKIEQLKAQIDDKMFVEQDKRIRRNILGAANNLPEPLIYAGEGALFGTSGDTYREMKLFYQEQTQKERKAIEKALKYLGFETKIIPIIKESNDVVGAGAGVSDETAKAQAALRGSVGGVQGILGIQQSVSAQTTDFESAITILMEIYGFDRGVSAALLGQPEIKEDANTN